VAVAPGGRRELPGAVPSKRVIAEWGHKDKAVLFAKFLSVGTGAEEIFLLAAGSVQGDDERHGSLSVVLLRHVKVVRHLLLRLFKSVVALLIALGARNLRESGDVAGAG
jgi:hypothetical protein